MLKVTLAHMRQQPGRLIAAGLAIVLGSAFVSAVLLGSVVVSDTTYNSARMELAGSDLVILPSGMGSYVTGDVWAPLDRQIWEEVLEAPGVETGSEQMTSWVEIAGPGGTIYTTASTAMTHPELQVLPLNVGELPAARTEVVLTTTVAERLGVEIGESLSLLLTTWDDVNGGEPTYSSVPLTVTGIVNDPSGLLYGEPTVLLSPEIQWELSGVDPAESTAGQLLIVLKQGADVEEVRTTLSSLVGSDYEVRTSVDVARARIMAITGDQDIFTGFALAFAALALVVASLVINNTFQVLVAARARQLALQRCIGATKKQVFRAVILEALILGLVASTLGILLALAVVQGALVIAGQNFPDIPIPDVLTVSPAAVIVPLLAGSLVTVLAAISPARAATRVSPLAAMRPLEATETRGGSKLRLVLSLLATIGGSIGLGLMVAAATLYDGNPEILLLGGILFGTTIVAGILIGAVFIVPRVVGWLGRALASVTGHTTKLATSNAIRNPRRITTTASALFIGSALVTTMLTGAAAVKATLGEVLDAYYPIDIVVSGEVWSSEVEGEHFSQLPVVSPTVVKNISEVDGVSVVAPMHLVHVFDSSKPNTIEQNLLYYSDPDLIQQVMLSGQAPTVSPGEVYLTSSWRDQYKVHDYTMTASSFDGSTTLELTTTDDGDFPFGVLSSADFEALGGDLTTVNELFIRIAAGANEVDVVEEIRDIVIEAADLASPLYVTGIAVERAGLAQVVDTVLLVIMALLGVAIIIAFVGVANTLALSVIERRKENATLRALGLTRGKLRALLATEGVLISSVGAVIGVAAGLVFGWTGTVLLLSSAGNVVLPVPWIEIVTILGISVLAGLVASVIPARAAVRTAIVVALANE